MPSNRVIGGCDISGINKAIYSNVYFYYNKNTVFKGLLIAENAEFFNSSPA